MGEATGPVERREENHGRRRVIAVATAAVVAVVAVVVVVVVAGGGSDDDKASSPTPVTASQRTSIDLPLGDVSADSAGPALTVSPEQSQQVISVLRDYVTDAIVQPLR